jgi:hypothetical protein
MTTIACCVNNEMGRPYNDNETMGTVWPAGQILRRQHQHSSSRRRGVGVKGSQGGGRQEGELGEYCA